MPFVEKAMSRNRFDKIKSYMHFNDNSRIDNTDKALKIRPFRSNCYEAWTDTTVTSSRQALVEGLSTGAKTPTRKGKRLIVVYIGNENGFLEDWRWIFECKKLMITMKVWMPSILNNGSPKF